MRRRPSLAVYTVHEPPNPPADRLDRADALVFVKDGYSWLAALVPPLFFLARKDWMGFAIYAVAAATTGGLLSLLGASPEWMAVALLALGVFVGFEASSIERWALDRKGFQEIATTSGSDLAECERRFFDTWLATQPVLARSAGPGTFGMSPEFPDTSRNPPKSRGFWRRLSGAKA